MTNKANDKDDAEFDVVVIGSGAGGMTAATTAAHAGLSVLLIEKTEFFGGTTAYSGGVAWVPNNHLNTEVEDSREQALTYLQNVLGNRYEPAKIEAYVDTAPKVLRYLEKHSSLAFVVTLTPDYQQDLEGALQYRSVLAQEFDGRELGDDFQHLRRTLPELTVFGSMQVAARDIIPLRNAFRTVGGFLHTTAMVTRYGYQRVRYGRGTRLISGNALAARLLKSARDAGVELWRETKAVETIQQDGAVTGLVVERSGKTLDITARHGVVLATGGFGANEEMRKKYMPMPDAHLSVQPDCAQGEGIEIGVKSGGRIVQDNPSNAIFIPISQATLRDGRNSKFPHIMLDRYMPGCIAVGADGKRFVNEGGSYLDFVMQMHKSGLKEAYLIADRKFLRKYGMGLARAFPYPIGKWLKNGYLTEGKTLADLAGKLGIDAGGLENTVADFNTYAETGHDPDFLRGGDSHSRYRGDQDVGPNPSLGPIRNGPFYSITLYPGDLSSVCGLSTNENAQVLNDGGAPVDGLYAVGLDMNSMTRGLYPSGGASLGPAITFGFIAARHIAAGAGKSLPD